MHKEPRDVGVGGGEVVMTRTPANCKAGGAIRSQRSVKQYGRTALHTGVNSWVRGHTNSNARQIRIIQRWFKVLNPRLLDE
jgi:hypothetical protein